MLLTIQRFDRTCDESEHSNCWLKYSLFPLSKNNVRKTRRAPNVRQKQNGVVFRLKKRKAKPLIFLGKSRVLVGATGRT